ncbi:aromatic ring-hydroxylating oxygenase subunit alpha [Myxococcus virescens]|uniref:aromatic ring-hydroxylating oxygenase subunit alpha n=1 Tax=Myxococcus virescens TaxID=83456 RepID=UPI003DA66459
MHASVPGRYSQLVDTQKGLVRREIFVDEEVFRDELRQIFGRCWLYLAHESQVPAKGDYVNVFMGTESVLVCMGRDGKIRAFLNSCRHRGNRVCRADRGNASTFVCPYHGWSYDLAGKLVGVPGAKELYHGDLDRSQWGLAPVAQVASYKGLIFGTFDPEAPPLEEYLGDMRWGLDLLLDQGDLVAVPGTIRWSMACNWKLAADNGAGDTYHALWTHRSAVLAGHPEGDGVTNDELAIGKHRGFTMVTGYGHGYNADWLAENVDMGSPLAAWRRDPVVQRKLGPFRQNVHRANQNVFPNLFVNTGSRDLMVRNPISPTKTETWRTILVDKNADPEIQRMQIRASNRHFGPGGMFEQDDGENFEQCTSAASGAFSQAYPLHYGMGLGHGQVVNDGNSPPRIDSVMNEHAQLWMYRAWAEFMDAPSWKHLRQEHSRPEGVL